MFKAGMTIEEAARMWVSQLNAVPRGMIEKLMLQDMDDWREITLPVKEDRVQVYASNPDNDFEYSGTVAGYNAETGIYMVEPDGGGKPEEVEAEHIIDVEREEALPMWGTMWSFYDWSDNDWAKSDDGLRALSDCGFRVYESDEFGIWFGIDGAGYDFYGEHLIPLYKARGLQWHDPATVA